VSSRTLPVEARMEAVAVEFDFMQPGVAVRRRVDQLCELRRDPLREAARSAAAGGYRTRHAGRGEGLRCRRMRRVAYPSATARRAPTVRAAS
jgi:hypothetical protein